MIETFIVEFVVGLISSFLGFFSALYLQRRTDRENQEKRYIVIIKSIAIELSDISLSLKQYIDKNQRLDRKILTPNFDALLNSGMIIDLIEKDVYSYVIDGFSMVKRLNDETDSISADERMVYMRDIVKCSDNVLFLTKKYKEGDK